MKIRAPKNPDRQQVEKIAQTIVIHMKENEDADPYDMIRGTGLSDNLQEVLLNKFNIHNFLHDFHGATGDPHSRDVGSPPLSLDTLFGRGDDGGSPCGCGSSDGDSPGGDTTETPDGTKVTKIEGPGVKGVAVRKKLTIPLGQAKDMHDMSKGSVAAPPAPPPEDETVAESKVATSDPLATFEEYPTHKLRAARDKIKEDVYQAAHRYRGDVTKIASILDESPAFREELVRCHTNSRVVFHVFQAAGRDLEAKTASAWIVQSDPKVAALVQSLEDDLTFIGQQQTELDLLDHVLSHRVGE